MSKLRPELLFSAFFSLQACCHLPDNGQPISELSQEIVTNQDLTTTQAQRVNTLYSMYYRPDYQGNILTESTATQLYFSDQTVFLGNYIAWQGLRLFQSSSVSDALTRAQGSVGHIRQQLTVPSNLPGQSTPNYGYFMRDNVNFSSLAIGNQTYQVTSDFQNGTDDEMSQDQLIHVLFGYDTLLRGIAPLTDNPAAQQLAATVREHADQMGVRLKAYNYIVTNPQGQAVKRGADARAFAWPIAQTISKITSQPMSRYLVQVDLGTGPDGKQYVLSEKEMRDLWFSALDLIRENVCDIQIGPDKHYVCQRFVLALINNLYLSSRSYEKDDCYVKRMEADGDWYRSALARLYLRHKTLPEQQMTVMTSAIGVNFSGATAPALWCYMSRWIYLPSSCPQQNSLNYFFNGLDFLALYEVLQNAPAIKDAS